MRWAKAAIALGLLLTVVGFCMGTDTPISTKVAGQSYGCHDVITSTMLVSGQPVDRRPVSDSQPPAERRLEALVDARCESLEHRAAWVVWGAIGTGAVILLMGWTAVRERDDAEQVATARPDVPAGI
jgi:hypothetical protein